MELNLLPTDTTCRLNTVGTRRDGMNLLKNITHTGRLTHTDRSLTDFINFYKIVYRYNRYYCDSNYLFINSAGNLGSNIYNYIRMYLQPNSLKC